MKTIYKLISYAAVLALLLTSCSKEEDNLSGNIEGKATLSFGAVLNDLMQNKGAFKQAMGDIPACSEDVPAFVEIVLTTPQGGAVVGTLANPLRVNVNPNPGDFDGDGVEEYFTDENASLELEAGTYRLQYFTVLNSAGEEIWVAPVAGESMANFVQRPIPFNFDLGAGVKEYIDVEVLCFEDRLVNEYGYLFFDIETNRAIEFCIFGNYCPPSGRHYPAAFNVDVWMYSDGARGAQLYDDLTNTVAMNDDGDYAGSPLCVVLPDLEGQDEYYFEISLMDSDAYGDVTNTIIRRGVITDDEVRSFFDGDNNLDYYHFREGCEGEDGPPIFQNPDDKAKHYKACLYPENGSKAFGFAYFSLEGNTLRATVMGTNLEAGRTHLQHIHENADCDAAGPPILSLTEEDGSWPMATGAFGTITYNRVFTLGSGDIPAASAINPLQDRTVNLHGMTVGESYNAGIVVACGELALQEFE